MYCENVIDGCSDGNCFGAQRLEPNEDVRVNTLSQDHSRLQVHMSEQLEHTGMKN